MNTATYLEDYKRRDYCPRQFQKHAHLFGCMGIYKDPCLSVERRIRVWEILAIEVDIRVLSKIKLRCQHRRERSLQMADDVEDAAGRSTVLYMMGINWVFAPILVLHNTHPEGIRNLWRGFKKAGV